MASPAWHYVLKFIITGNAAVGKSSLLVRLTDQRFLVNPDPTLGVEFGSKLITLPDTEGTVVKLQCWDTAGTESFRSITRSYYRGAAGCLLVYDVTSRRSFKNVRTWLADVRAHVNAHIPVGNKRDLCEADGESVPSIQFCFGGSGRRDSTGTRRVRCCWRWAAAAILEALVEIVCICAGQRFLAGIRGAAARMYLSARPVCAPTILLTRSATPCIGYPCPCGM
ncbi:P-loop containing nucleoside triphosphate hydrolase protein [Mycena epipterygia]|nr:P-loop containing nucleoside triphosphate hydrolase protein [Mycena epipterygia]